MTQLPEFDNEPGEILQEQEPYEANIPPIPVVTCEPVRTQELPARHASFVTVPNVGSTGVRILDRDPRRKHATVIGLDQDIRLGSTQAVAAGLGARIPAVVPFVITSLDEVWATSVGETTDISVITEYWAE